jgi:hypothetical protein
VFNRFFYRDKKVVGVFVRFRAPYNNFKIGAMKKVNIIWIMVMALCHNFNAYVRAIALRSKIIADSKAAKD